ncbi:MAG: TIGR02281 family clan AA aspartic protease [Candidatus Electrothrix sp. GM3_4]|nr:TIGR02281 family clan AA aspartic protease [Candidatus Electrothrix sp. GM3_4]
MQEKGSTSKSDKARSVSAPPSPAPSHNEQEDWSFPDFYGERKQEQSDQSVEPSSCFFIRFLCIAGVLIGLLIYLNDTFHALSLGEDSGQILYAGIFILFASATLASGNTWRKIKQLAIWAAIGLVFMVGFSYRYELVEVKDRLLSEVMPSKGLQNTPNSVTFPVSSDGHFYIRAQVNGVPVVFLADTGASSIVLSLSDAKRLGINPAELAFDRIYETANGTVRGSSVRVNNFKVQGIQLHDIRVSINEAEMSSSLLGMTFFKRLKRYEVKEDKLTLHWEP